MDALSDNLRHCLKDRDAYVRKTAAICVLKMYNADPRRAEKGSFVEMLRDLMLDSNATVVANAVAALSEIGDRHDGVTFKLNLATANKLLAALGESSECVLCLVPGYQSRRTDLFLKVGPDLYPRFSIAICP